MLHEGLTCAINGCHMGITAEEVATRYGVSRADQDAFAAESQRARRSARSRRARSSARSSPVDVPQQKGDAARGRHATNIRAPGRRSRSWRRSKPAFKKDGIGDRRQRVRHQRRRGGARRRDRRRRRRSSAASRWRASWRTASTGVDPMIMGMGPVPAMRKALERAGLDDRRHRPVRAERGVRRRSRSPSSASWGSIRRRSTSTAARSRSAIRSARAARAC